MAEMLIGKRERMSWIQEVTSVDSGTTTSTSAGKLVQTGQDFQTTVSVRDIVHNTTDDTYTVVTAVDSDTTLSLQNDIMTSGEAFVIYDRTWGTGGTMTDGQVPGYDCTITPNFSKTYIETLSAGADARTIAAQTPSAESLNYTMTFVPYSWHVLLYLFNVVDAGSDPYTHTCTVGNELDSFKLEWAKQHTTDHVLTLTGNVVKNMTISWSKPSEGSREGNLNVSLDCIAKALSSGTSVTTLTGGNPSSEPFQFRHVKLTIGGDEIVEVNGGEMTISNGINEADSRYANSTLDMAIGEPTPTVHRVSGRINVNLKDSTFFDHWDTETAVSGTCKLEFIQNSTTDKVVFTFTNFYLHQAVAPTTIDGVTNVDLIWVANSVAPVVTDSIATYEMS